MKPLWLYVHKSPKYIKKFIQWICGLKGHIVGDTDYCGGDMLNVNCKWCNYYYQIPLSEMPSKSYLKDIFKGGSL